MTDQKETGFARRRRRRPPEKPRSASSERRPGIQAQANPSRVRFVNLDKVFWPELGYTKGDLVEYYKDVSAIMLPYLKDRPERIHRQTEGIGGKSFWHNDMAADGPRWVSTANIYAPTDGKEIPYLLCQDADTLLFMANMGCIEIHPWHARVEHLDRPDYAVFDIDPFEVPFEEVVKAALETRRLLDEIEAPCFCKTSGGDGLHVYVPLGAKYTHEQSVRFAELINKVVNSRMPLISSTERHARRRKGKVYLDHLQNGFARALVAPYSVRPRKSAAVSTPLEWREVNRRLDPGKYTLRTIRRRLDKAGDLWPGVLGPGIDMPACLERLAALLQD
ncbi:MAG TPA: non-homologous end-joining DNA ligase [Thermodesulfobacteriota bacterium]|nr:non-homologous end-joining DNA ligase [Thermodesulfobacteriota bacterium]